MIYVQQQENQQTHPRKLLNLPPIRLEKRVSRFLRIMLRKLGVVKRLDVITHIRPLYRPLVQFAIAKVISVCKIAFILRLALFCVRDSEEGLAYVVLPLDFQVGEACVDDAEEACFVDLKCEDEV